MELIGRIESAIEERHLLGHPFYQKWLAGTLPPAALRDYARQYYAFEAQFPRVLSALHSRTERADLRAALLQNLWDEEHGATNHAELWLQFAEGLGLSREDVTNAEQNDATRALVATYWRAATEAPVAAGVAAVYAYERQFPAVARAKIDGLRARYGVDDARTLAFFQTHVALDADHAAAERTIVSELSPGEEEATLATARAALDAWWRFLDAVDA